MLTCLKKCPNLTQPSHFAYLAQVTSKLDYVSQYNLKNSMIDVAVLARDPEKLITSAQKKCPDDAETSGKILDEVSRESNWKAMLRRAKSTKAWAEMFRVRVKA